MLFFFSIALKTTFLILFSNFRLLSSYLYIEGMKETFGLLTLLLLSIAPIVGANQEDAIRVMSGTYGPYEAFSPDKEISISIYSSVNITNAYYQLTIYSQDRSYAKYRYASEAKTYLANKNLKTSFTLPTMYYLNPNGMIMDFEILNLSNRVYYHVDFTLFPKIEETYNPYNYINEKLTLKTTRFSFSRTGLKEYSDSLQFRNFVDYFLVDSYYRLTLKQFSFTASLLDESFDSAYLYIENYKSCFSSLTNSEGIVKIPLVVKKDKNTTFSIDFADILYVEPQSLFMSLTPKTGYKATHYFYLPINKMSEVNDTKFIFEINGISDHKINLRWEVNYANEIGLIGDCSTSEYCLVGGAK